MSASQTISGMLHDLKHTSSMSSSSTLQAPAAAQQYCLKWNHYSGNLIKSLSDMAIDGHFVDVTLSCEGKSLRAHKTVLSCCSNYFKELFLANPCKHPIVILKDMRFDNLRAIVDFMYKGEVNVSQTQLGALLQTAEILRVKGLTEIPENDQDPGTTKATATMSSVHPNVQEPPPNPISQINPVNTLLNNPPQHSNETTAAPSAISNHGDHPAVSHPLAIMQSSQPGPQARKKRKRRPAKAKDNNAMSNLLAAAVASSVSSSPLAISHQSSNHSTNSQTVASESEVSDDETIDIDSKRARDSVHTTANHNGEPNNQLALLPPPSPIMVSNSQVMTMGSNYSQYPPNRRERAIFFANQPRNSNDLSSTSDSFNEVMSPDFNESSGHPMYGAQPVPDENDDDSEDGEMMDVKPLISFDEGQESNGHGRGMNGLNNDSSSTQGSVGLGDGTSPPKMCVCHLCHLTFTAYSSLRRHMARHYTDRERYECDVCFKSYSRKDYLKEHKKLKHNIASSQS